MSYLSRVAELVERRPEQAFWVFLALHVALWSLLPIAVHRNPALDVVEGTTFGQHWQILYWKHPPLPWLIVDTVRRAFGPQLWPLLLVAQLSAGLALWAVWRLAREILPPLSAFAAVALLEGSRTFTYGSEALNHDMMSVPFWALAAWFFWRAVRDGRRSDFVLTGIWFGVGVYAKYSIALLLLTTVLFLVAEPMARRRLATAGPWIGAGVLALIVAPQLWALASQPVQPFAFAQSHANRIRTLLDVAWQPADFLVNQMLHLAPLIVIGVYALWRRRDPGQPTPQIDPVARRYVAAIALGPTALALVTATAAGYGLRWSWGASFWNFIGLGIVTWLGPVIDRRGVRRLLWAVPAIAAVSAISIVFRDAGVGATDGVARTQFAGTELARQVQARWERHTDRPLPFVVGDFWVAGNVSFHLPERPLVFVDADRTQTPWIDAESVRRAGGVIVWRMQEGEGALPAPYARMFPEAQVERPVRLTMVTPMRTTSQWFGVAVVNARPEAPPAEPSRGG